MLRRRRSSQHCEHAAPALIAANPHGVGRAGAQTLKVSHQFPGGTIDEGDFRDRLCRKFAAELERRTNVGSRVRSTPIPR